MAGFGDTDSAQISRHNRCRDQAGKPLSIAGQAIACELLPAVRHIEPNVATPWVTAARVTFPNVKQVAFGAPDTLKHKDIHGHADQAGLPLYGYWDALGKGGHPWSRHPGIQGYQPF